jgi:DNA primase
MNIITLLRQDGKEAKRVAGTHGGEYASPCPICGGNDRFRSWPEQGDGGRWWCRRCEKGGDLIQYLRDIRGLSYWEARKVLGLSDAGWNPGRKSTLGGVTKWQPLPTTEPAIAWKENAEAFVAWSEDQLRADQGKHSRDWLRNRRGLSEETTKAFRLGWNPKSWWIHRETWGLPEVLNDKGKPKKLWIPGGLVIPIINDGTVQQIRIRRAEPDADPRYVLVSGSSMQAMVIPGRECSAAVVVESALDALLIHQEADDLATTIALGSAQLRPDQAAMEVFKRSNCILLALDADQAGAKEAWGWWQEHLRKARRWPPAKGKDITEMFLAGVSVRDWVQTGLREYNAPFVITATNFLDFNKAPHQYAPELRIRDEGIL